jgi:hypothetical protein
MRAMRTAFARAAMMLLGVVAYASPVFARAACYPPYGYFEWLIQGSLPESTYCGSIKESRVASAGHFFGVGFWVTTVSMPEAQRLAG